MITEERVIISHLSPEATLLGDITGATIISDVTTSSGTTFGVTTSGVIASGTTTSGITISGLIILDTITSGTVGDISKIKIPLDVS